MDFCSVKNGIENKVMEMASKNESFKQLSPASFSTDEIGIEQKLNEAFGGNVIFNSIKKDVDFVFEQSPELSKIGTPEQYSQYLDTIFPDSKVKDILYHGTQKSIDSFFDSKKGIYFSGISDYWENNKFVYAAVLDMVNSKYGETSYIPDNYLNENQDSAIKTSEYEAVNWQNMFNKTKDDTSDIGKYNHSLAKRRFEQVKRTNIFEAVVFKKEQIHVLGSKQDIEGFKNYISKNPSIKYNIEISPNIVKAYIFEANKELLDNIQELIDTIKFPAYREMAKQNPELFLFEIAQQANSSDSEAGEALKLVGEELFNIATILYPDATVGETLNNYQFDNVPLLRLQEDNTFYSLSRTGDYELLQRSITHFLQTKLHLISRWDYKGTERYYFTKLGDDQDFYRINSYNKFSEFMAFHNFSLDMFIYGKSKDGVPYIEIKHNYKLNEKDRLEGSSSTGKQKAIANFLARRFQIKDRINWITKEEFKNRFPKQYRKNVNSAILNGQIYLFPKANNEVIAEELLHPFIEAVYNGNNKLFIKLLEEAKKDFPKLVKEIEALYVDQSRRVIEKEIVTQALARIYTDLINEENPKPLSQAIKDLTVWIRELFKELLKYFGLDNDNKVIYSEDLSFNSTLEDIARIINTTDTLFPVQFSTDPTYNLDTINFTKSMEKIIKSKKIDDKVTEILKNIPAALKEIESKLSGNINKKERKQLSDIRKALYEASAKESLLSMQINTIVKVINVFELIEERVAAFENQPNVSEIDKLKFYMSSLRASETLDGFSEMMTDLYKELDKEVGKNPDLVKFFTLLRRAIALKPILASKVEDTYKGPLLNFFDEYLKNDYKPNLDNLDAKIKELQDRINNTNSNVEKIDLIKEKDKIVKEKEKLLQFAPTRENLQKVFDGNWIDANKFSQMFEASIANGHFLVSGTVSLIEDAYLDAHRNTLENRNRVQVAIDEYAKATGNSKRNPSNFNEKIISETKIPIEVVEKEDGSLEFKYVDQLSFISDTDPAYITKYLEYELTVDHLYDNYIKAKINKDGEKEEAAERKWKDKLEEFRKYKKDNTQGSYKDKKYEDDAILDELIKDKDGNELGTVREMVNDIYKQRDNLKQSLFTANSTEEEANIRKAIRRLNVEIKFMSSLYRKDGSEKKGVDKKIAEILKEYNTRRYKNGEYKMTDESSERWELDKSILEEQYSKKAISKAEYTRRRGELVREEIAPAYFEVLLESSRQIDEIMTLVLEAIDEDGFVSSMFDKTLKEKTKESYKKIQDLVRGYRDENGIIDGIFITAENPAALPIIKEIQQSIEDLKYQAYSLKDVSKEDANKIRQYESASDLSNPEYQSLIQKRESIRKFYTKNKDLVDALNAILKARGEFSQVENTEYYEQSKDEQINLLKKDPEIEKQARELIVGIGNDTPTNIYNIRIVKRENKWYQIIQTPAEDGKTVTTENPLFNISDETDNGEQVILDYISYVIAQPLLEQTVWWEQNHYTKYIYNKLTKGYDPVATPIYIWQTTTPTDPQYILGEQPSNEYKVYTVNDNLINKDFRTIYKNVPAPKEGMHKLDNLSKLSADEKKYLNVLREVYYRAQGYLPESDKMGDVLPSLVRTSGENSVNITNNLFSANFKEMINNQFGDTDTDTSHLLGGGQLNLHIVPKRFISRMDKSKQSRNIPAAILLFDLYAQLNNNLNEKLPILEATRELAENVKTLKTKDRNITKKGPIEYEENTAKESNLNKSVGGVIDMLVYGQTAKPAIVDFGPFGRVDGRKVLNSISGFFAKTIFVGNLVSAINNSLSTRLQAIMQSARKYGIYTASDLAAAQAIYPKYTLNFLDDWTKVGNKSLIGQVMEYFDFSPESLEGAITSKTEFFATKHKIDFLTSGKSISEFEALALQFFAIANTITIKKGDHTVKMSSFEDVFELKNGTVKLKADVEFTDQQQREFIRKFKKMSREIGGAYRASEQTQLEREWWGQAAMFMRKYFVPLLTTRFQGQRWSKEYQKVTEGYMRATFKNLRDLFTKYHFNMIEQWDNLSPDEKVAYWKAINEFGLIILVNFVLFGLGGWDDKKELKKNSYGYNLAVVALMRAKAEIETFNAAFGMNELVRMARTPFIATKALANTTNIIYQAGSTILGAESAYYKNNSGLHSKGDSKLVSAILKSLGYTGNTFNLSEYIINFRTQQNVAL